MKAFCVSVCVVFLCIAFTPVRAAPFNDPGDFASVGFGGVISGVVNPLVGSTVSLVGSGTAGGLTLFSPTEEFGGFLTIDLSFPALAFSAGPSNDGLSFTATYDRSGVSDLAEGNAPGSQTGTLTFTVTETAYAFTHTQGPDAYSYSIGFLVDVTDDAGFYGLTVGSLAVTGVLGTAATSGAASFSLTVPSSIAAIPVPAAGLLLATALAGLGAMARRRRAGRAATPRAPW